MLRSSKSEKGKEYGFKKFEKKTLKSMLNMIGKRKGHQFPHESENETLVINCANKEETNGAPLPRNINEDIEAINKISSYFDSLKVILNVTNLSFNISSLILFHDKCNRPLFIIIQDHIVPFTNSSKNISNETSIKAKDQNKKSRIELKCDSLTPDFEQKGTKTSFVRIPKVHEDSSHHPSQVTITTYLQISVIFMTQL